MAAVVIMSFVDTLLVIGIEKLWHHPTSLWRSLLTALVSCLWGGLCLACRWTHWLFFVAGRALLSLTGFSPDLLFWGKAAGLMSLSLGLWAMSAQNIAAAVLSAGALCLLRLGEGKTFLPVHLRYGDKVLRLTALRDTGCSLTDPITGRNVLVVGAETATYLTGLSPEQLRAPLQTMGSLPGLRLIPYRSVGGRGFLLALPLDAQIGTYRGSALVAFSPEGIGNETFSALTGGNL